MTKDELNIILNDPDHLTNEQLSSLEALVINFPYCQVAHTLIAKAYYQRDNMLTHQKIRTAGVYASDRKYLKTIIEKNLFSDNTKSENLKKTEPEITTESKDDDELIVSFDDLDDGIKTEDNVNQIENKIEEKVEEQPLVKEVAEKSPEIQPEKQSNIQEVSTTTDSKDNKNTANEDTPSEFENDLMNTLEELKKSREQAEETKIVTPQEKTEEKKKDTTPPPEIVQKTEQKHSFQSSNKHEEKDEPSSEESAATVTQKNKPRQTRAAVKKQAASTDQKETTGKLKPTRAPKKKENKNKDLGKSLTELSSDEQLGYKIQTSRLGEALQERDEITPELSQEFYPDLMLEYLSSRKKRKLVTENSKKRSLDIINKFIKTEPRIEPVKDKSAPQKTEDLSVSSTSFNPKLVSENLAKINVKQGNIKRAIAIYQELILKYPEKKTFFASEIEKLKNT